MNTRLNAYQKVLAAYFIFLVFYWAVLRFTGFTDSVWNFLFSFLFSLVPLIAGLAGCFLAKSWGWLSSAIGRTVFFVSLGSFLWGAGSMVWSYYNFFADVAAPYPSIADLGFILSLPCWVYGIFAMSKATGAHAGFRQTKGKIVAVVIASLAIVVSYYLLVVVARGGTIISNSEGGIKLFLDFAYPMGDVVILTCALLVFGLSFKYLGGAYRLSALYILFGFGMMYIADFIFSYTTTLGTFYNGDVGDLLFAIALTLISLGALGFTSDRAVAQQ